MMETEKGAVGEIVDDVKDYIDTNVELYKLQAIEKSGVLFSSITINLIILMCGAFVLLFFSIALALALSSALHNTFSGFIIVGGIYAFVMIIVYMTKDKWLKTRLVDSFIKTVLSK